MTLSGAHSCALATAFLFVAAALVAADTFATTVGVDRCGLRALPGSVRNS